MKHQGLANTDVYSQVYWITPLSRQTAPKELYPIVVIKAYEVCVFKSTDFTRKVEFPNFYEKYSFFKHWQLTCKNTVQTQMNRAEQGTGKVVSWIY